MLAENKVAQTVSFVARFHYNRYSWENNTSVEYSFDTLEEMETAFRKEKRRRANKDKVSWGEYKLILTEYGKNACKDSETWDRHKDSIEIWHNI